MTRQLIRAMLTVSSALSIALAIPGCVERKEKIVIAPDGSVKIKVVHASDSVNDIREGDAPPSLEGGWWVEERDEIDGKGKHTYSLIAEAALPPGATLPSNFAALKDPDRDLHLQFPTTIKVERRSDGVYYHFRRVYTPRPWAQVDALSRKIQEQMQALGKKPRSEVTREDRMALVRALVQVEIIKRQYFARQAFEDAMPQAPQDAWLRVHAALAAMASTIDVERLARLIEDPERGQDNGELIEAEIEAFDRSVLGRMREALAAGGLGGGQVQTFLQRYDWRKRYHEITEDLGDDSFDVSVEMPGEVIASNADSSSGAGASWRFAGEFVRDREIELMATSRMKY